jgi:hypothetical protein
MKRIITTLIVTTLSSVLMGQASLPTSWDFSNTPTPPKGWSYNLGTGSKTVYTTGSFVKTNPALRLDFGNEYVQVNFADAPGNFVYHIAGTGSSPWQGKVEVQESVNGTTFTAIKTYNNADITGSTKLDSVTLSPSSRYVRIFFSTKVSGYNLAIDDAVVRKAPPTPPAEINITYKGNDIISGSTLNTGNESNIAIDIENNGTTEKLYLSNVTITGADASDFTPSFIVDSVDAQSSKSLNISFAPSGMMGDKKATLQINSNDANESSYIIHLYAISGELATEPLTPSYYMTATTSLTWKKEISLSAPGNRPDGWILIQTDKPLNTPAMDKQTYELGQSIGNGKVIYKGTDTQFLAQEVVAKQSYRYNLFPFNGYDTFINYSGSPVQLTINSVPNNTNNYYSGIGTSDASFITKLQAKINPHFQVYYSNYSSTIIKNFYERDTTGGRKVITAQYSNYLYQYNPPFGFDTISREHVYPYSWMPETNKDKPNYSDLHNLHPVHQNKSNGIRSNYPLGEVDQVLFTFIDSKFGRDTGGNLVYEPRDAQKGACARSMFYMLTCYNGADGRTWWLNPAQSESLLKKWHNTYPPNKFEIARNNYIASLQNNRNPFIDSPQMACYINFYDMSYNSNGGMNCTGISTVQGIKTNASLQVFPNPSNNTIRVQLSSNNSGTLKIYDITGRLALNREDVADQSVIDISQLTKGSYLLIIEGDGLLATAKLTKQ